MSIKDFLEDVIDCNVENEKEWIEGYCSVVGDILNHPKYELLRGFNHHKIISCHFHSVYVSFLTYKISTLLGCDVIEATRAAALHDFYLYDWHITKHDEFHAWYHPKMAVINSQVYFEQLSKKQTDMILSHMWPLHLMPPKSREGMILTMVDKYCTSMDMFRQSKRFLPVYHEIDKEVKKHGNIK